MKPKPLGFLSANVKPDVIMMICTAGHVDHGKTALVKLLTGCNTDRLKVEQERGMTIELGFAPCYLGGNLCVGVVDVPGHEKFVKNMAAGVSGIGLAILVIAADDGVMPQTVEHLQIMELLGVKKGIVALTKIDLVSPEIIDQRKTEISNFLKDSFLKDAPICPVSSETFEGYFEFYDILVDEIKKVIVKQNHRIFRMPIERIFSREGFGTVVSGIPIDGKIKIGDQVEISPIGQKGRIRGIQRFGRDAVDGGAGQCLALNIADLKGDYLERGQVISLPNYLKPASIIHVKVKAIAELENPLKHGDSIKFHIGTSEVLSNVFFLEYKQIGGGEAALATVVLAHPIAAAKGDRFIIRKPSPARTVAGGEILDFTFEQNRPKKSVVLNKLNQYLKFINSVDMSEQEAVERAIEYYLIEENKSGASREDISKPTLINPEFTEICINSLINKNKVLKLGDNFYVHEQSCRYYKEAIKERLEKASAQDKLLSLPLSQLKKEFDLSVALWDKILQELIDEKIIEKEGNKIILKSASGEFNSEQSPLIEKIKGVFEKTGYETPRPDELAEMLKIDQKEIDRLLEYLCNEKILIKLNKNVFLSYTKYKEVQDFVVEAIKNKGIITTAEFKDHINTSRKYALAILEYLDERKITVRSGNDRKLTHEYERFLI